MFSFIIYCIFGSNVTSSEVAAVTLPVSSVTLR